MSNFVTINKAKNNFESQGFIIEDVSLFESSLQYIGELRIEQYISVFSKDTSFKKVIDLYFFDKKLRILFFEAIEEIEIAIGSVFVNTMESTCSPLWYSNEEVFLFNKQGKKEHDEFIKKIIQNNTKNDTSPKSSILFSHLTLGAIKNIYTKKDKEGKIIFSLKKEYKKNISDAFSIQQVLFESFIHNITDIRNICAHNDKLWNIKLLKTIKLPKNTNLQSLLQETSHNKIFPYFFVISHFLKIINPKFDWERKILDHLQKIPEKFYPQLGFPDFYPQNLSYLFSFYTMTQNTPFLRNPEVVKWCYEGITENSLRNTSKADLLKASKKIEDEWGNKILNTQKNGQWTTRLCESLVKEALEILGRKNVRRTTAQKSSLRNKKYSPDLECDEFVYEVKGRTWNTSGTAGEKILGVPLKYAEIPKLYGKPLKIILVGYQEWEARNAFAFGDLLDSKNQIPEVTEALAFYKERGIEYIGFTDILKELGLEI